MTIGHADRANAHAPDNPLLAEWNATVLVADDDTVARGVLIRILEGAGYSVIQAGDGSEARRLVAELMPDLLMLDINMPGADGVDLCREVKSDPRTGLVPIIHVTGSVGQELRILALRAGSDEFVAKPFDSEELLTRVRAADEVSGGQRRVTGRPAPFR